LLQSDGLFSSAVGLLRASVGFSLLAVGLLFETDREEFFHDVSSKLDVVFFEPTDGCSKLHVDLREQSVVLLEQSVVLLDTPEFCSKDGVRR
jgi:hypothetical protein